MFQKEDVFETSDLPEDDQHALRDTDKFESEHIERIHLDVDSAYQKFKGKGLNTDQVDFSDSLVRRRRKGYGGGHYVLELIGTEITAGAVETPEQKFNRLHHEINELSQELQDVKVKAEKNEQDEKLLSTLSVDDVSGLQQQMKNLQIEQVLGQEASLDVADPQGLFGQKLTQSLDKLKQGKMEQKGSKGMDAASNHITYEINFPEGTQGTTGVNKVAELESRLAKLEVMVGQDVDKLIALSGDSKAHGVVDAVEMLQQKLQLLDAHQIDALDARMTALMHKMTQVNEKKQQLDSDDVSKVSETYELLKKWDPFCSVLPDIVARMQALQQLHEQAILFSQSLTQIDGVQQQIVKTLATDSTLLNEVKNGLAENMELTKSNCEAMEKRIKALTK